MSITRTPWVKSGDLKIICDLLFTMAGSKDRITNLTVLDKWTGTERTPSGINTQLRRLENSLYGCSFSSDVNALGRMNVMRQYLSDAGFTLDGPTILATTESIVGAKHEHTGPKTESDGTSLYNDDFTHVFTNNVITKLVRWERIKTCVSLLTNVGLAKIGEVSVATAKRYRSGYADGPPLVFIQKVEAAFDI